MRQEHVGLVFPAVEEAPLNLEPMGRYLLGHAIFDALRRIKPVKGGELQLTGAVDLLISEGHPSTSWSMMASVTSSGTQPASFQPASNSVSATRSTERHCYMTWKRLWKTTGWSETRRRRRQRWPRSQPCP